MAPKSDAHRAERALKTEPHLRDRMQDALAKDFDRLLEILETALQMERKVRVQRHCPKPGCGCNHIEYVKIKDVNTALKVAEFFASHGIGRAPEDRERAGNAGFTVIRTVTEATEEPLEDPLDLPADRPAGGLPEQQVQDPGLRRRNGWREELRALSAGPGLRAGQPGDPAPDLPAGAHGDRSLDTEDYVRAGDAPGAPPGI